MATRRSDVYSLGALLFELCTGYTPHRDAPMFTLSQQTQRADAPRLIDLVPGIDPRFSAVIERCLCRNAADRFASGDELREALEQVGIDARGPALPRATPTAASTRSRPSTAPSSSAGSPRSAR